MTINIVSRIASDKDFFHDYITIVALLRKKLDVIFELNFIGPIESMVVFEKIIFFAKKLDVQNQISFSKKELTYEQMPNGNSDYYVNISIGDFVGYSSIECIEKGFKTIFVNMDKTAKIKNEHQTFCADVNSLYNIFERIYRNSDEMNYIIKKENQKFLNSYYLNENQSAILKRILNG